MWNISVDLKRRRTISNQLDRHGMIYNDIGRHRQCEQCATTGKILEINLTIDNDLQYLRTIGGDMSQFWIVQNNWDRFGTISDHLTLC